MASSEHVNKVCGDEGSVRALCTGAECALTLELCELDHLVTTSGSWCKDPFDVAAIRELVSADMHNDSTQSGRVIDVEESILPCRGIARNNELLISRL